MPTPTYGPNLRSLSLPAALGAPLSDDSMIARRSSFTCQGASAIVASGGETEAEAVLGQRAGSCGGAGGSRTPPPGPLPLTATCSPGAPAKQRAAGPEPRPYPGSRGRLPSRWLLPGLASPLGAPSRLPGPAGPLRAKGGVPALASGRARPQPPFRRFPLPLLPRLLWAPGQRPSSRRLPPPRAGSRPHPLRPGGAASEDLSGTPGSPARARRGGVLGAGRSTPAFHVPFPAGLPLGRLCLFLSARSAGLSLPWVFWGGRKGPGGGRVVLAGNPAPPRDLPLGPCQAGLQGGRASSWFPPLPAWSQTGRKAPLPACDPDPRPGQRSQPSRPCLFQPAGVLPRPRPHQMLSFAPPHPHSWHSRVVLSHAVPVLRAVVLELPCRSGPLTRQGGRLAGPTAGHVRVRGGRGSTEARHFVGGRGRAGVWGQLSTCTP